MQIKEQFAARYVNLSTELTRPKATQLPKPIWGGRRVPAAGERGQGRGSRTFLFSGRLVWWSCFSCEGTPSRSVTPVVWMEGGPHSGQNSQRQILASGGSSARVDPLTSGGKWTSLGEWLRTPWSQLWSWREPGDITASRVKAAFVKICNSNDFQLVPSQIPTWALPYWPGTCLAGSPPGSPRRSHLRAQDSADHRQKPPAPQNYTPNSHHTGRAAETKRKQ